MIISMPDRPADELRCPTCGARQAPSDACRRCKSDLRLLVAALGTYEGHRRASLADLEAGRLDAALRHARRCHDLRPDPESHRLLALCRLVLGDWPGALGEGLAAGRAGHTEG